MNNQKEYLDELKSLLSSLPGDEVKDIIQDYTEHFEFAKEAGKSEEEIIKRLGKPKNIAQAFKVNTSIDKVTQQKSSTEKSMLGVLFSSLIALLMLAPLNFLIIFGPALAILGILIGLWGATLLNIFISSALYFGFLTAGSEVVSTASQSLSILFSWIGLIGLSGLLAVISYLVSKFFIEIIFKYIKWNINFVINKSKGSI